jgi:hypothetical protein
MMYVPISIDDVHELHPSLARVLAEEVARGNLVTETWRGWPNPRTLCVRLERPFSSPISTAVPDDLSYELVDDPHYWYEELRHANGQMIITTRR